MIERILIAMLTACLVVLMFIGSVVLMKLVAEAFARLVLWTGDIWGMEYR